MRRETKDFLQVFILAVLYHGGIIAIVVMVMRWLVGEWNYHHIPHQ